MGSLFRSEEMRLCQVFLQIEAAYACVSELGELGQIQFKDLNENVNAFQRTFVNEIRRCEEMERKLRYTEKEILKEGMSIPDNFENPKAPAPKEMNDLEILFEKMDTELRQVNTNNEALKQNHLELLELKEVLDLTQAYFTAYYQDIQHMMEEEYPANEEAAIGRQQQAALGFFVGTILREKVPVFERVLKFITHSTVFVKVEEIPKPFLDPVSGDVLRKCMFLVFFHGEQLRNRVRKVCEGMRGTIYPVPDTSKERMDMLVGVQTRISDLENVLAQSNEHRMRVLGKAQKEIRSWTIKVEKIKAIYHTLNMFKVHQNSFIAECWFPVKAIDDIRRALYTGERVSGSTIPSVIQPMVTDESPPTYYNCNKFVKGFQNIVDAYGVANYGEVNPAPYTVITFPFLFAVMFGDAAHGLIMFLFGLYMVVKENSLGAKKMSNEIAATFFGGRYIIMMMGLFSIYTGIIYNDFFSKSMNIFGSHWHPTISSEELTANDEIGIDPVHYYQNSTAYLVGVDPIWQEASNKIVFLNTLKMKMAIILGVIHMLFGVALSVFNHVHFRNYVDILVKFVPEVLFLGCLFGYLVVLIFYKWLAFDAASSKCAPSLLIHYINMFMFKYGNEGDCNPTNTFYDSQESVQKAMIFLALLSVPVLLIAKPLYVYLMRRRHVVIDIYQSSDPLLTNEVPPAEGAVNSEKRELVQLPMEIEGQAQPAQINEAYQHDTPGEVSAQLTPDGVHTTVTITDSKDSDGVSDHAAGEGGHGKEHEHEMGEVIIHQVIETIEFCLGCISHTASYLRLWALSLAHAQLSEVLWTMVLRLGITMLPRFAGGISLFIIFFIWANLTIAILLLMEGLSAFLHTLRLHWVEFQSKFYGGGGYQFLPFTFQHILDMQSLEEITS
jgi:V-type H+-transporting ATPase subunit a